MIPKKGQKVKIAFEDSVEYGVVYSVDRIAEEHTDEVAYCIALDSHSRYIINEKDMDEMCTVVEDICNCYHETDRFKPYSDGECWGTKEKDPCNCGGDKSRCEYYPEKPSLTCGNTEPIPDLEKVLCVDNSNPTITPIVDIHKIIDDAMEKKDRAVHILILPTSTSVNVTPYSNENSRWIDNGLNGYECPECHGINDWASLYCPICGATVAKPEVKNNGKN